MLSLDHELAGASSGKRLAPETDAPKVKRQRRPPVRPMTSAQEKPPKDPNAPKKPPSSYFIFLKKERGRITEAAQANLSEKPNRKQVAEAAANAWKEFPSDRKEKVEQKALKLKTEWQAKMEAYKKTAEYKLFQEQMAEFKANQARQVHLAGKGVADGNAAVATRTEAQGALSEAELAKTLSDDALINEVRRRVARSAQASTGDHAAAAAVEPSSLPLSQEGQEATTFEKTPGYKAWYESDRGKMKIKEELGSVPKEVIRQESVKRWLALRASTRANWETAATADSHPPEMS